MISETTTVLPRRFNDSHHTRTAKGLAQTPLIQTPDELLWENENAQFTESNARYEVTLCDKPE